MGKVKCLFYKVSMLVVIVFFIVCACSTISAAEIYYISSSGNDIAGSGTSVNPWATLSKAFNSMLGGDILIVKDGVYSGWENCVVTSSYPPKGSAGNYTIVRAENDGAVLFDGEGSFNMFSVTPSTVADYYWQFEGLLWANNPGTNVGVLNSRYIKFLRCGAYNAGIGNNVNFSAGGGSEFILFENCYAFGSGRYKFLSYMASKIIFRQCVGRMDWCNAINDPIGIFAIYSCDDVEVQNCIAIDSDTSAYWSGDTQNIGGFGLPSTNQDTNRVTIDSCISLNLALGGSWITGSEYGRCNDIIIKNSVYWDCTQKSGQSIYQFRGFGDEVENCTFGVATHDYYCFESYNAIGMVNNTSIKNSIIYNYVGNPGLFYDIESEGYNCLYANYNNYAVNTAQGAYTTLTINPVWNVSSNSNGALKYIVKIESGSSLSLQGEGSVDIGANVTTFVGVSGTQWGDTDYNIETGVSMWPFPNEDLIRSKMKVYTGGGVSGDRGFCADGQTLTKYIWGYLGNPIPFLVPPTGLSAVFSLGDTPAVGIVLTWEDNSLEETGYRIERKEGKFGVWISLKDVGANVATYTDTDIVVGATYYYRLKAFNVTEETSYSNEALIIADDYAAAIAAAGSSGGGGCFIATAAFGTPLAKEVVKLSEFRDKYLMSNFLGKQLVEVYYKYSPPIADYIKNRDVLKSMVRIVLRPLVLIAEQYIGVE